MTTRVSESSIIGWPCPEPIEKEIYSFPLSAQQRGLWFIQQLDPASATFNMPLCIRLWGALDESALERALSEIHRRHEILRTTFSLVDEEPRQQIHPPRPVRLPRVDLSEMSVLDRDEVGRRLRRKASELPINLEKGPVLRMTLLRLGEREFELSLVTHHIANDGWSESVFLRELTVLYEAYRQGRRSPLPELPVQYADYTLWQRDRLEGTGILRHLDYWRRKLEDLSPLQLPRDFAVPIKMNEMGETIGFRFPVELSQELQKLAQREGVTLFIVLLAGFKLLLSRYSGQKDIAVGTVIANRNRIELENLIGCFVNTLVLRTDLQGPLTFRRLIKRVEATALEAFEHQDVPYDRIVQELNPERRSGGMPIVQATFVFQNAPPPDLRLEGLQFDNAPIEYNHAFEQICLAMNDKSEALEGTFNFSTELFARASMEQLLRRFKLIIAAAVAAPDQDLETLSLLTADERARISWKWNATNTPYEPFVSLHGLFERQATRTPEATAVVCGGQSLSYFELESRSNRLAHYLRARGIKPDNLVGICAERSIDQIVAILGTLKSGGAYLPIDPDSPRDRVAYMLQDARPGLLLTQAHLAERLPVDNVSDGSIPGWLPPVWLLDDEESELEVFPASKPEDRTLPSGLAYVIYTSGSSGRPKGVMATHGSVVNHAISSGEKFEITSADRVLQFASISFDASVEEIFTCLTRGATLVLRNEEAIISPSTFLRACRDWKITVLDLPTAYWIELTTGMIDQSLEIPPDLRLMIIGGDTAHPEIVRAWLNHVGSGVRLINTYGPTEATIVATSCDLIKDESAARLTPIGRPIANTRVYTLDENEELVPPDIYGEIVISGAGIARGYLNRPDLTAERFTPDPFTETPGLRMCHTGDIGRWTADGTVEFLGRNDFQVKIRGYRIELGEIEMRMKEYPGVREAVVVALEGELGDKRLAAYYTAPEEKILSAEALRAHLISKLPEYMVPACYVFLKALPLTTSGKLDRKALPAPGIDSLITASYTPPRSEIEMILAAIWSDALKIEKVGRRDNFFDLGGHSLLAARLAPRLRKVLGVEATVGDLFRYPVLADFARAMEGASRVESPPLTRQERTEPLPLSFAQQRLWFLAQMEGASEAYHIPFGLRLRGELDREALRRALDRIVIRHEALRTTFKMIDGEPSQQIEPAERARFELIEQELERKSESELERVAKEEAERAFDLESGPLIRGRLIREGEVENVLLITMHHIVSDGWSMGLFFQELGALYEGYRRGEEDPLPELPAQYADYAIWQRRWIGGEILEKQAEYWKERLAGAPALLELPTDHPRPAQQDYRGASVEFRLDVRLTEELKAMSRRNHTTLYMTLLAGWAALLSRLTGQEEVVIGTPVANRSRAEVEGLIGFFVNTLALRIDLKGSPGVDELLERVKEETIAGQRNQDIPFEQVVELSRPARNAGHNPLFQAMFAWQSGTEEAVELSGLEVEALETSVSGVSKFDLTLGAKEENGAIVGVLEYATALFEEETIERYVGYWGRLLEEMARGGKRSVGEIPLMGEAERRQVLEEWNATEAEYPREECVHRLFEAQAAKNPQAIAAAHGERKVSYAGLNAMANRGAERLRELGVNPGDRVTIALERSVELLAAQLAVLKCGAAYTPIDLSYPAQRQIFMATDSESRVVITSVNEKLPEPLVNKRVNIEEICEGTAEVENLVLPSQSEMTAYVMYTSGSTGEPKGVIVSHRGIVRLTINCGYADFNAGDRVAFAANPAFDASTMEVWGPLLNGGRVVIIDRDRVLDPLQFAEDLERGEVNVLWLSAGLYHQYAEILMDTLSRMRILIVGGEALDPQIVRRTLEGRAPRRLINGYGPTESATFAITHEIKDVPEGARSIPLGRPINNTRVYILDKAGRPAPIGVVGEIYIGGDGVAQGYLNRPDLTQERFLPDPFGQEPGGRIYKTGDLGRWLPDGVVEFLGRNDHQIKIRGFRIEMGEIETRLAEQAGVREAVVAPLEDGEGGKRLVAYYTGEEVGAETLRARLASSLPEYMLPMAYVRLQSLPLTPNGKLDRRALPEPEGEDYSGGVYEAPLGEFETELAKLWMELFHLEKVGRWDNFFDLGGHSLMAARIRSRVGERFGLELPQSVFFHQPTIAGLAEALGLPGLRRDGPLIPLRAHGDGTPLFLVHAAGGGLFPYRELTRALPTNRPIYGLERPGYESGVVEDLSIPHLAALYLEAVRRRQPHGPYIIAGWSLGGLIAFEMARQLENAGESVAFLGLIDTRAPLGRIASFFQSMALRRGVKTDALFNREFHVLAKTLDPQAVERIRSLLHKHVSALASYSPKSGVAAKRVLLFRAADAEPGFRSRRDAAAWQALSQAPIETHVISSDHYSILEAPHVAFLAGPFARALADL
jgi:amino acid adenylation domain-containing protein